MSILSLVWDRPSAEEVKEFTSVKKEDEQSLNKIQGLLGARWDKQLREAAVSHV